MTFTTWTWKDRRISPDAHCLLCGDYYGICTGEPRAHKPSTCKACSTKQCWTRGLSRGQCSVCYIGLLDAFSAKRCGYKGCGHEAVAAAPRVRFVCAEHLERCKNGKDGKTLRQAIDLQLTIRDRFWEEITFDMDTMPKLGGSVAA